MIARGCFPATKAIAVVIETWADVLYAILAPEKAQIGQFHQVQEQLARLLSVLVQSKMRCVLV
jgi:hypothetical protein